MIARTLHLLGAAALLGTTIEPIAAGKHELGLSDEAVPFQQLGQDLKQRPAPLTERIENAIYPENRERQRLLQALQRSDVTTRIPARKTLFGKGDRFLSPGPTGRGGEGPLKRSSARPYWILHGQFRSGLQGHDRQGGETTVEWANRLDLFADYLISPTERFHLAFRPLDVEGVFTGYTFDGPDTGWDNGFDAEPQALFFEGQLGEMFPAQDRNDRLSLDYSFALGRQPVTFQDGVMINDTLDAIGITRHDLFLPGTSASRITALWAPGQVHRNDNERDRGAQLFGFFTSHDLDQATVDLDAAYVTSDEESGGDGVFAGLSHVRRFGHWNSTFRANGSWALDQESEALSSGYLFTHELSRTMPYNHDIMYFNAYLGEGNYASAARGPSMGGPLGQLGLLYQNVGWGTYEAALGNRANDSEGFALGYQHFPGDNANQQFVVELGGRSAPEDSEQPAQLGLGLRYQQAINQHQIVVLDGYVTHDGNQETDYGARAEMRVKF